MRARPAGMVLVALCAGCAAPSGAPRGEAVSPGVLGEHAPGDFARREPVVESVEPWTFDSATGSIIRTRHYRIFTTEQDPALTDRMPDFCERALDHYRSTLGPLPAPPVRLDTYLMDNRPQWTRVTQRLTGQQDSAQLQIRRGGFATRGVGVFYDIGLYDTMAIAAHEGWHQYTQRTFREPLPAWLEEGVATFMEGHRWDGATPLFLPWANVERYDRLRQAHAEGGLLPLAVLSTTTPQELMSRRSGAELTYYAQVWALVHFLNEGDGGRWRTGLRLLLADAAAGRLRIALAAEIGARGAHEAVASRSGAALLEAYLGEEAPSLDASYRAFVERVVRQGGRDSIVRGRSPLAPAPR